METAPQNENFPVVDGQPHYRYQGSTYPKPAQLTPRWLAHNSLPCFVVNKTTFGQPDGSQVPCIHVVAGEKLPPTELPVDMFATGVPMDVAGQPSLIRAIAQGTVELLWPHEGEERVTPALIRRTAAIMNDSPANPSEDVESKVSPAVLGAVQSFKANPDQAKLFLSDALSEEDLRHLDQHAPALASWYRDSK